MNSDQDHLIHAFLNDALSADEMLSFSELMRESNDARLRFWELAEIHGLAQDAARLAWPETGLPIPVDRSSHMATFPWYQLPLSHGWRALKGVSILVALLAGIVCGVLSSSLAWAWASSQSEKNCVLLREGFETGANPESVGVPLQPAMWSGDSCSNVTDFGAIKPISGNRMLRFIGPDYEGKPIPGGSISEVYYLLDCREYRHEFKDGNTVVTASARFNADDYPVAESYNCGISVYALDSQLATSGASRDPLKLVDDCLASTRRGNQQLDRDISSWQTVVIEMHVPPETEYLLLRIAVGRPPSRGPEDKVIFAGHFADDVRVSLSRRPVVP